MPEHGYRKVTIDVLADAGCQVHPVLPAAPTLNRRMEVDVLICVMEDGGTWKLLLDRLRWPELPAHLRHAGWVPLQSCTLDEFETMHRSLTPIRTDVLEMGYVVFRTEDPE